MSVSPPEGYESWPAYTEVLAQNAVRQHGALQDPLELAEFCAYAAPHQPRVMVEIGSHKGGCWHALTHVCAPDALCISIDYELLSTADDLRRLALPGQAVSKIHGNSHDHETIETLHGIMVGHARGRGDGDTPYIDLLFIDGDHHYGSVKQDHEWYGGLVRTGGIIAFHDIKRDESIEPGCEASRYWREVVRPHHETWESVHTNAFGIGAYTKGA